MKIIFTLLMGLYAVSIYSQMMYDNDRHNTSYNAAWLSCIEAQNPNPERGTGHWIMYDLSKDYELHDFKIWNLNDPSRLDEGIQELQIDVSSDGVSWINSGSITVPMADGSGMYMGHQAPSLQGVNGRYVLLTAISNYGGNCTGLGEIRIDVQEASLPVTLVDQKLTCLDGNFAEVSWITESEVNNEGFTVYFSQDGVEWSDLGQVKGKNRSGRNTYNFILDGILDNGFVRISQKDFDGSTSHFPVLASRCGGEIENVDVFPNPFSNTIHVTSVSGDQESQWRYEVTTLDGKTIRSGYMDASTSEIELSDLIAGYYYLTMDNGVNSYRKSIIKQ